MPLRQRGQHIGTHYEEQLLIGMTMMEFAKCVGSIARSRPVFLQLLDAEGGLTGDGQRQHFDALRERRYMPIQLERRLKRRDEPDFIEVSLFATLLGHDEVTQMDGVERAAEDADSWFVRCS